MSSTLTLHVASWAVLSTWELELVVISRYRIDISSLLYLYLVSSYVPNPRLLLATDEMLCLRARKERVIGGRESLVPLTGNEENNRHPDQPPACIDCKVIQLPALAMFAIYLRVTFAGAWTPPAWDLINLPTHVFARYPHCSCRKTMEERNEGGWRWRIFRHPCTRRY